MNRLHFNCDCIRYAPKSSKFVKLPITQFFDKPRADSVNSLEKNSLNSISSNSSNSHVALHDDFEVNFMKLISVGPIG